MADSKISGLTQVTTPTATVEFGVNDAGTSKRLTLSQVGDYLTKRTAAATVAYGDFMTWLVLAANSTDITGTGLTTVMSITGIPTGRYHFKCVLIYQTTATTTGIDVAVNFTGTLTQFLPEHRFASTGQTAATAAASQTANNAAGNTYEAQGTRTLNAVIGSGSVSVDAANTDMMSTIEGFMVVSVSGDLQIKLAAESAGLVCRAMQGSFLELKKLS
jgi:hypothetical protein